MLKRSNAGSVLLITMVVTSFISSMLLACWWQSSLTFDIVLERELSYKQLFATEVVLHNTMSWAKNCFDELVCNKNVTQQASDLQLLHNSCNKLLGKIAQQQNVITPWQTQIEVLPYQHDSTHKKLFIRINLLENGTVLQTIRCLLNREKNRKLLNGKKQPFAYTIECFTLGTAI